MKSKSKLLFLLPVIVFLFFGFGCERPDYTLEGCVVSWNEPKKFTVLTQDKIGGTNLFLSRAVNEDDPYWIVNLITSQESLVGLDDSHTVRVVFIRYYYDNRGNWVSIPVILKN